MSSAHYLVIFVLVDLVSCETLAGLNITGDGIREDIEPTTPDGPKSSYATKILVGAGIAFAILITILGNIVVIVSFCRFRHLQTYTRYFIVNLAVSDLLVGCVAMPLYGTELVLGYWPFGKAFCEIFIFCEHLFTHFSVVSAIVISLDRFVALTQPFFYRRTWRTKRNAAYLIALTYIVPILIWLPLTILWSVYVDDIQFETNCQPQYARNLVVSIIASILFFWIPVLVVVVLYYNVYKKVRETLAMSERRKIEQRGGSRLRTERRDVKDTQLAIVGFAKTLGEDASERYSRETPRFGLDSERFQLGGLGNAGFNPSNEEPSEGTPNATSEQVPAKENRGIEIPDNTNTGKILTGIPAHIYRVSSNETRGIEHHNSAPNADEVRSVSRSGAGTANRGSHQDQGSRSENDRAAKILGVVVVVMIVTWSPWAVIVLVTNLCGQCLPKTLYAASVFLGYMNSTLNPLCYAIADRRFRQAFGKIVWGPCRQSSDNAFQSS